MKSKFRKQILGWLSWPSYYVEGFHRNIGRAGLWRFRKRETVTG